MSLIWFPGCETVSFTAQRRDRSFHWSCITKIDVQAAFQTNDKWNYHLVWLNLVGNRVRNGSFEWCRLVEIRSCGTLILRSDFGKIGRMSSLRCCVKRFYPKSNEYANYPVSPESYACARASANSIATDVAVIAASPKTEFRLGRF